MCNCSDKKLSLAVNEIIDTGAIVRNFGSYPEYVKYQQPNQCGGKRHRKSRRKRSMKKRRKSRRKRKTKRKKKRKSRKRRKTRRRRRKKRRR